MTELKPCPFCGEKAFLNDGFYVNGRGTTTNYYYAKCYGCKAKTDDLASFDGAVEAWNRRQS